MYKTSLKILFVILAMFVIKYLVFATDNDYKNTLLKVDLRKNANGSFNVILQTEKPYLQRINVQKRSDNEYVLILPETFFSGMSKAALPSNVVNLDVRLFPYLSSDLKNGFTKITITTNSKQAFNPIIAALPQKPAVIASASRPVMPVAPKTPVLTKPVEKVIAVAPAKPVVKAPVKHVTQPSKPAVVTTPTIIAVAPTKPVVKPIVKAPVVALAPKPVIEAQPAKVAKPVVKSPVIAIKPKPVIEAPSAKLETPAVQPVVKAPVIASLTKPIIEAPVLRVERPLVKPIIAAVAPALMNQEQKPIIAQTPSLMQEQKPVAVKESTPEVVTTVAMKPIQEPLVKKPAFERPKLPEFSMPTVKLPEFKMPEVKLPKMHLPQFEMPELTLPTVAMPEINLPEFKAPSMPVISMPKVSLPKVELPRISMPVVTLPEVNPVHVFGNIYQFFAANAQLAIALLIPLFVPFIVLAWFKRKIAQADTTNIRIMRRRKEIDEELETEEQEPTTPAINPALKLVQPVPLPPKLDAQPISNVHFKIRNEQESFDKFNIPKDAVKSFAKPIQINKIQTTQDAKVEFNVQPVGVQTKQTSVEPQLLETYNIDSKRGFYLIRYEKDTALVGFIEDAIFVLNKFKDLSIGSMRAMLSHSAGDNNMFIVKSGVHRGLYRVSPSDMKFVMEL